MNNRLKVGIIGAGIQGISNALFLQRKGFDEMADELTGMSQREFNRFVSSKVHEQKLRKQIRAILSELLQK